MRPPPAATILMRLGERPRLLALALGVIAALGFEPLALWPFTLIGIGGLFVLLWRTSGWRQAALLGWLFGLGHFTFGNSWIATAFTYQTEMPALLGWLAVPLLSLYLALFPALALAAARLIAGAGRGWALALAFAGCWIISEWLRGWVFTGFPWNPLGVALLGGFARPGLALLAPWLGTYALSGLAVLLACVGTMLIAERRMVWLGLLAALVTAGMFAPSPWASRDSTLAFTLVQPDIRQDDLYDGSRFEQHFAKTVGLSVAHEPGEHRIVLWPESGIPDYLEDGYPPGYYVQMTAFGDPVLARERIARLLGPGSLLMTGSTGLVFRHDEPIAARNTVIALGPSARIDATYAKAHLVPYGEYLPMRWLLEPLGLSRLVPGAIDFWPGPGPRTLDLGSWGQAGVQICYEIVFSGEVVDRAHRPDYIFNPSNDGWFGLFGPPQHLAQARLRAIEEGLPVLRSTTTGISAVIDPHGVVRQYAPFHRAVRLDGFVPAALPPTLFARLGNRLALGWAVLLLALAGVALRRARR